MNNEYRSVRRLGGVYYYFLIHTSVISNIEVVYFHSFNTHQEIEHFTSLKEAKRCNFTNISEETWS